MKLQIKSLSRLRQDAKLIKKSDPSVCYAKALDLIARREGLPNWKAVLKLKKECIESSSNNIQNFDSNGSDLSSAAAELLAILKDLAKSPICASVNADTAVGRAIEKALGIEINSSKLPDFNGIEIKSSRIKKGRENRYTLFAQVADWSRSPLKSSSEILDAYGYERGLDKKLYCTVSTQKINTQGLSFYVCYENSQDDILIEKYLQKDTVAIWTGKKLRERLLEKHAETFWIHAESFLIEGVEHFLLKEVVYTRKPFSEKFMSLVESGIITMDHLIKRKKLSDGKFITSEKGPLFKIDRKNLHLLFPDPIKYSLIDV